MVVCLRVSALVETNGMDRLMKDDNLDERYTEREDVQQSMSARIEDDVRSFSRRRVEELAEVVRIQLRDLDPSDIFAGEIEEEPKNLWDEYMYATHAGLLDGFGGILEEAWEETLGAMAESEVAKIEKDEVKLIAWGYLLENPYRDDEEPDLEVLAEARRRAIARALTRLAEDEHTERELIGYEREEDDEEDEPD